MHTPAFVPYVSQFSANLNQAAAAYTLCTASGLVVVYDVNIHVVTAAGGLNWVSIQSTNTSPVIIMTAAEGAVANLSIDKSMNYIQPLAYGSNKTFQLSTGQLLQYTINGVGNAGLLRVVVTWQPMPGVGGNLA